MNTKTLKEIVNTLENGTTLELHVPNLDIVRKFYSKIGFEIVYDKENYLVVAKDTALLCFWGENGMAAKHPYFGKWEKTKRGVGIEIAIPVKDVEKYYEQIKSHVKVVEELKIKPWKIKDFRIEDPNGYYVRFTEPINWKEEVIEKTK